MWETFRENPVLVSQDDLRNSVGDKATHFLGSECDLNGTRDSSPQGTGQRLRWLLDRLSDLSKKLSPCHGAAIRNIVKPLTPNDTYRGRTAPLTSKVAYYIFIQQI